VCDDPSMLDLRRLQVLCEVERRGSFSGAAEALNFTPSAVSHLIAQLEQDVGARLFERRSTGVVPTDAGRYLLEHATAILARAADAEAGLKELLSGSVGRVRVAAFTSAAVSLIPDAVLAFLHAQPRVEVEVVEQDREESIADLRAGRVDLAVTARSPRGAQGESDPTLDYTHLLDEPVDVMLPLTHRLASAASVSREELAGETWADCGGRRTSLVMASEGVEPTIAFTSDNYGVLQRVVASGIAVAFIPRLAQQNLRADVVVKPITPRPPVRTVQAVVRGGHQSLAVKSMLDMVVIATELFRAAEMSRAVQAAGAGDAAVVDAA
jgi:DNA-binding transcriptional LysR family regulator